MLFTSQQASWLNLSVRRRVLWYVPTLMQHLSAVHWARVVRVALSIHIRQRCNRPCFYVIDSDGVAAVNAQDCVYPSQEIACLVSSTLAVYVYTVQHSAAEAVCLA